MTEAPLQTVRQSLNWGVPQIRDLCQKLYPKNFRVPHNYLSPADAAKIMAMDYLITNYRMASDNWELEGGGRGVMTERASKADFISISKFMQAGCQTFFIARTLLGDIEKTDIPDFDLTSIEYPFDSFLVCLPCDSDFTKESEVNAILFSRFNETDLIDNPAKKQMCPVGDSGFCFSMIRTLDSFLEVSIIPYSVSSFVANQTSTSWIVNAVEGGLDDDSEYKSARAIKLALGILLAMIAAPEIIGQSQEFKKAVSKPNGVSLKGDYGPRWIGAHYLKCPPQGGHHDSPRMHWRRGHYRFYKKIAGWKFDKVTWIRPMLIAAPKKELVNQGSE